MIILRNNIQRDRADLARCCRIDVPNGQDQLSLLDLRLVGGCVIIAAIQLDLCDLRLVCVGAYGLAVIDFAVSAACARRGQQRCDVDLVCLCRAIIHRQCAVRQAGRGRRLRDRSLRCHLYRRRSTILKDEVRLSLPVPRLQLNRKACRSIARIGRVQCDSACLEILRL